jgi:mono/diheme cytochrome c family protein
MRAGAALAFLFLLSAGPGAAQQRDLGLGGQARAGNYAFDGGKEVYTKVCQGCHMSRAEGARGAGASYPALAGNVRLSEAGYPLSVVIHGGKTMPAFGGILTDMQIADVVNYIRMNFGNRLEGVVTKADVKAAR